MSNKYLVKIAEKMEEHSPEHKKDTSKASIIGRGLGGAIIGGGIGGVASAEVTSAEGKLLKPRIKGLGRIGAAIGAAGGIASAIEERASKHPKVGVFITPRAQAHQEKQAEEKPSPVSIKPSHKGRLHAALGVAEGEKIPEAKLLEAKNSKDPHMRRMATYALNARKWKHTGHKEK